MPTPQTVCLHCHKTSDQNIVLKCDHELCLNCAEDIKTLQNQNPLDVKYRIVCPYCRVNTITLNLANLISQEQEKLVFVNMEESELSEREFEKPIVETNGLKDMRINKLKEMSYNDRIAVIFTDRRTPDLNFQASKRGSVDSNHRQRERISKSRQGQHGSHTSSQHQLPCPLHPQQPVLFYCRQQCSLLCMQCMYKHMKQHKSHTISSIKDSLPLIQKQNQKFKLQSKHVIQQVQSLLLVCKSNKSRLEQAYLFLQQMIKKQFKQLETMLKAKEKQVNDFLERTFEKRNDQLKLKLQELNQTKAVLTDYYRYQTTNLYQHIYFFTNFKEVQQSLNEHPLSYKIREFKDEDLLCFHRNSTTKDFQSLMDKLFVPKIDGRQSGQRSRATSRGIDKNTLKTDNLLKEIPQETIKLAKRKMKQINRKIDSSRDFKKDKKYDFLQNMNIGEVTAPTTNKKTQKGSSLNQKSKPINAWTPTPQLDVKAQSKKVTITKK